MATKAKKTIEQGRPEIAPEKAIELINKQIEAGEEILQGGIVGKDTYSTWELLTKNYLEKAFGRNSPNITSISSVGKYGSFPMGASEG